MKILKILGFLIVLQILTHVAFAQQEPQHQTVQPQHQAVQQEPQQQIMQHEPQPMMQQVPQQPMMQQVPQQPMMQQAPQQPMMQQAPQQPMMQQVPQQPMMQQVPQQPMMQQAPQQIVQQEPQQAAPQESGPPVDIITLDLGPTIIGLLIGAIPIGDLEFSAFGFGVQYERQLFERLSIAGRFAYLGSSIGYTYNGEEGEKLKSSLDLSSFSLEAHPRVYPFGSSFFLDGMIGYADMSIGIKGDINLESGDTYDATKKSIEVSRGYFKYGVKLGWRADFGEPGGFIFEHSYGYYGASGSGSTFGKQLSKKIKADIDSGFDDALGLLEDWLFVGGVRMTFAFGWRF